MIELKLDDVNSLFSDSDALEKAQQSFPEDHLGDILIKVKQ